MAIQVSDQTPQPESPETAADSPVAGLEVVKGADAPQFHPFEPQITLVGRARFCHVRAPAPGVSPVHCLILRHDAHYLVHDLESQSGTFLSGDRVSEAVLRDGDELTVGPLSLRICLPADWVAPDAGSSAPAHTQPDDSPAACPADAPPPEPVDSVPALDEETQHLAEQWAELNRRETRLHKQLAEFDTETRNQRLLLADSAAALRKQWKELATRQAELQDQAARLADQETRLHEQAQSLAAAARREEPPAARDEAELQAHCDELLRLCASLESRKAQLDAAIRERLAVLQSAQRRSDDRIEQHEEALEVVIDDLLDVGTALAGPLVSQNR